jgi:retron-type reverse transcriptase
MGVKFSGGGQHVGGLYDVIISIKNLFDAWGEFKSGKIKKKDVSVFAVNVEENLFLLRQILIQKQYQHGKYTAFFVHDPKLRSIHKAQVIDRVLHHALVQIITPLFDKTFIFDSYSSRKDKGTHKAGKRFREFAWKLSQNNTRTVWVLKCDIRKFFDSVDHEILFSLIKKKIKDENVLSLLKNIIWSFQSRMLQIQKGMPDTLASKGIPLGNLTSQLFSNIYLDVFDQFVKRDLQIKHYIRYADDFVVLSADKGYLDILVPVFEDFLLNKLKLSLHPKKVIIQKWHQGVDFLGFVHFPYHSVIRTKTRNRILGKMKLARTKMENGLMSSEQYNQILQSYLGRLRHCRSKDLREKIDC